METSRKGTKWSMRALALVAGIAAVAPVAALLPAQTAAVPAHAPAPAQESVRGNAGPPRNAGFYPLSQVRRGMMGTVWTVFEGTTPEPMQVEILGVLHGARGPGQDMILGRLRGAKPEYTGVVEGMSGSPVYIDGKLAGSLSYRIGLFAKDPIAGITPIEQMLEVRDMPVRNQPRGEAQAALSLLARASGASDSPNLEAGFAGGNTTFQPMETPLVMSGFSPEAIRFWQEQTAGTALEPVVAGGELSGTSGPVRRDASAAARATLEPGSAISMQLVRGDLEIAATCTVTYMDAKQLLACGHPVLGAGPVSLPMTTADVVTTLASPFIAFKIINTGVTVGAFTQDRESAIEGVLGAQAKMIPVHIAVDAPGGARKVNVEILDQPALTPLAAQVVLYESLLETNESSAALSYHLTGKVEMAGFPPVPIDVWASSGGAAPAAIETAVVAGQEFSRIYANGARQGVVQAMDLDIEAVPRPVEVTLEGARLISNDLIHAGDTIEVEATLQPWQQPERNVRIAVKLPARLAAGNLRLLVSDAATLDRTLRQPHLNAPPPNLDRLLAEARNEHRADRVYVTLLAPEAQAEIQGDTLTAVPLSVANAMEPLRYEQDAGLNGESAEAAGEAPAGGVLSGFQILDLNIEPGGGLN